MASHQHQHYIPRFLLEQWHTSSDKKLSAFRRANGMLIASRCTAKGVGKEKHIYSMQRSSEMPDVSVERDFLGPCVDGPGAVAHRAIMLNGVSALTEQEKVDWARFLVSLILRTPTMIGNIRIRGSHVLAAHLDESPEEYIELRGDSPEATLSEWVENHRPEWSNDLGVKALPELVTSQLLNDAVLKAEWMIRHIEKSPFDLLIGDNPLICAGIFKTNFLLYLPVAPRFAFLASNNDKTLKYLLELEDKSLARETNISSVGQAERFVYATSVGQQSFIEKYLRK